MRSLLVAALVLVASACTQKTPAPPVATPAPLDAGSTPDGKDAHLIITGHETGMLPARAPTLLPVWKAQERWPQALLLSTGDLFSGQALSSHFDGLPTAEVMKVLGYRAAALGNHDLELGLDTLARFREASGLSLLAANLTAKPGETPKVDVKPFTVLEQHGVKVGVVGLTSPKTLATTAWGQASGLAMAPLADALGSAVKGAREQGAQAVVVVVDDCFTVVQGAAATHPEWRLDLVVGSRCEGADQAEQGGTRYFSAEDDLASYISATVAVGASGAVQVKAARVKVPANAPGDEDLTAIHARWQKKLDEALGQKLGFAQTGWPEDAPELRRLVATALKVQAKADAALINKKGIRAPLPKGDITRATIQSMLPFENAVVLVQVPGEVVQKLKSHPDGVLVAPAKVDPNGTYTLVTTEYLYFGGDGLGLELVDPTPEPTGQMWQTPVVEWLLKQRTDAAHPLEAVVKKL